MRKQFKNNKKIFHLLAIFTMTAILGGTSVHGKTPEIKNNELHQSIPLWEVLKTTQEINTENHNNDVLITSNLETKKNGSHQSIPLWQLLEAKSTPVTTKSTPIKTKRPS